jgi:hypothetical protein
LGEKNEGAQRTGLALIRINNSSGFTGLPGGYRNSMVHSTTLATTVTGGVLRSTIQTPGTATWLHNNGSVRNNYLRLSVSQCVASGINTLCHFDPSTLFL